MSGFWLLPSHGRPKTLAKFMRAALKCNTSTPGLVLVQKNELLTHREEYDAIEMPKGWHYRITKTQGMGDKFREIYPEVRHLDWIGWVVDDLVPLTDKWDAVMISGLNGKNIISCNDGARAPFRMCAPVFSGDLLRAVGYIYAPGFWHTYMDDAWEAIGKATGSWWVCMDVVLKHEDAFQTGVADATHMLSYGKNEQDKAAFENWRMTDMDRAVLAIMNMKPEKEVKYG